MDVDEKIKAFEDRFESSKNKEEEEAEKAAEQAEKKAQAEQEAKARHIDRMFSGVDRRQRRRLAKKLGIDWNVARHLGKGHFG